MLLEVNWRSFQLWKHDQILDTTIMKGGCKVGNDLTYSFPGDPTGKSYSLRNIWTQKTVRASDGGSECTPGVELGKDCQPNLIKENLSRIHVCLFSTVKNWAAAFSYAIGKAFSTFLYQRCRSALVLWQRSGCMEKCRYRTIDCFQNQTSYCALTPTQINPLASVGTYRVQHKGRIQLCISMLHNNVIVLGYCKRGTMLKPLQIKFQHENMYSPYSGEAELGIEGYLVWSSYATRWYAFAIIALFCRGSKPLVGKEVRANNKIISFTIGLLLLHCLYRQITWQTLVWQHRSKI